MGRILQVPERGFDGTCRVERMYFRRTWRSSRCGGGSTCKPRETERLDGEWRDHVRCHFSQKLSFKS